ncbi:MAG TPA: DNA polymerase Y family protein [Alphaproteobacteria bacterium]|nr:DNA polymerase Y family protein [Alphaproteobacteria bacterium]
MPHPPADPPRSGRRCLALWLPWLPAERMRRRRAELAGRPLVLTASEGNRRVVRALDPMAAEAGLSPGMALADARALLPGAAAVEAEPEADARALAALADWAGRYSPWVGLAGPDGLTLDIAGCGHLWGGEAWLMADLRRRLEGFGYTPRLALAPTPGAAWALARFGADGAVLPNGDRAALRAALAPLPTAALRLEAAEAEGLARLGLRRIGDVYALPRAALARRFGPAPVRRLDQAFGDLFEPIAPRRPVAPHSVRLAFAEPVSAPSDIAGGLHHLLERLCAGLAAAGQGARRVDFALHRADGRIQRCEVGTARPLRRPAALLRLFAEKVQRLDPGHGIDVMVLAAPVTEALAASQPGLEEDAATAEGLAELVDRLSNRCGPVRRPAPRASWWPERAVAWRPALEGAADGPAWPGDRLRPPRLLPSPEPIQVTAPVPDDPPLLFVWRGVPHRVRAAEGPERLAPEWWRDGGPEAPRDYYRVEDQDGRRYWLYRLGLYSPGVEVPWYLHGFFG